MVWRVRVSLDVREWGGNSTQWLFVLYGFVTDLPPPPLLTSSRPSSPHHTHAHITQCTGDEILAALYELLRRTAGGGGGGGHTGGGRGGSGGGGGGKGGGGDGTDGGDGGGAGGAGDLRISSKQLVKSIANRLKHVVLTASPATLMVVGAFSACCQVLSIWVHNTLVEPPHV